MCVKGRVIGGKTSLGPYRLGRLSVKQTVGRRSLFSVSRESDSLVVSVMIVFQGDLPIWFREDETHGHKRKVVRSCSLPRGLMNRKRRGFLGVG